MCLSCRLTRKPRPNPLNASTAGYSAVSRRQKALHCLHPMASLHERAGEVFLAALSRPAAERDAFLVAACRGDEALLREVGSLLMFHEGEGSIDLDPFAERLDFSAGEVFAGRYRMIARIG